eukprot:13310-Pleurochrysis_carterae.AAC.1
MERSQIVFVRPLTHYSCHSKPDWHRRVMASRTASASASRGAGTCGAAVRIDSKASHSTVDNHACSATSSPPPPPPPPSRSDGSG